MNRFFRFFRVVGGPDFLMCASLLAAGPGTLYFNNHLLVAGIDAPVYDVDCQTPLGSGFLAQLYVGLSPDSLAPVGAPAPFKDRDGIGTGYVSSHQPVIIPFPAGSTVFVEMRAWEQKPCNYDGSCPPPDKYGKSNTITVVAGGDTGEGPPTFPADLVGLESFCLMEMRRPVEIVRGPLSYAVLPGQPCTFWVEARGSGPFSYQWRFNGEDIPGLAARRSEYAIASVGPEHLGAYSVRVSNAESSAVSAEAQLTFRLPPPGATVSFSNRAPGVDAPVFDTDCRTRLDGNEGAYAVELWAGASPETLEPVKPSVTFLKFADAGYIDDREPWRVLPGIAPGTTAYVQVRVWRSDFAASYDEAVTKGLKHGKSQVIWIKTGGAGNPPDYPPPLVGLESFCLWEAPVIVRAPESLEFYLGDSFALEVEVSSTQPVTYQWLRNGEAMPGATNAVLAVTSAGPEHVGEYTVRVASEAGAVLSPPAALQMRTWPAGGQLLFANRVPASAEYPQGLDVRLFEKDGLIPLSPDYRAQLYAGPTPGLLTPVGTPQPFLEGDLRGYWAGSVVAIPSVPPGDVAYVQVRVWSARFNTLNGPKGVSEVLAVTTGGPGAPGPRAPLLAGLQSFRLGTVPLITREPASVNVTAGNPAAIEVWVQSTHPVSYQWLRNGVPVAGATEARLAWDRVTAADTGTYRVRITSVLGSVMSTGARLTVYDLSRGTVNFANRALVAGLDAPVFDADGVTPLWGPWLRAQLWAGPDADHLLPVGEPAVFPDVAGPGAGYWTTPDRVRAVPNVAAGARAVVQVRVWDTAGGLGELPFEEALAAGAKFGASALFTVQTGGDGEPPNVPADLVGLTSFKLNPALEILRPPAAGVFFAGERAVLGVEARGEGELKFQWQRNGEDIPGATGATLEFPALALGDAGYYQVRVSDQRRAVTSAHALLAVAPLPGGASIRLSNLDPGVGLDAPVLFLDGKTPLAGPNFVAQIWAGATAETLAPVSAPMPFGVGERAGYWDAGAWPAAIVPGLMPAQTAFVQVRVWDGTLAGSFEEARMNDSAVGFSEVIEVVTGGLGAPSTLPVALTGLSSFQLSHRPRLTAWPTPREVVQNRAFAFEVAAVSQEPMTYQWFHNGAAIPGATGPRLALERVTPADGGEYTVTVANRIGAITSEPVRLTVLTPTQGGTIWLATAPEVGEPIFDADGVTRLNGQRCKAELMVGRAPGSLQRVGWSSPFRTGTQAGFIAPQEISLAIAPPDTEVWVRVRAWDSWYGRTYDEAAAQKRAGQSELFTVVTGGYGVPAGRLTGLKSFRLEGPEPPVIIRQPAEFYWVIEGTPIFYEILATNFVTVRWERLAQEGWVNVIGADSPRLVIPSATVADAGEFRAVLFGSGGTAVVSATATLRVGRVLQAEASGDFTLRVPPAAGPVFEIEGSTNLVQWSALTRVTSETGTLALTESPQARQFPTRYYRARSVATGQVASETIAGFVEVELLPGFSMIGLPLIPPSARVADLFAGMPEFSVLYKYYADGRVFTINTLWEGWTTPDEELLPGEACLLGNPTEDVYRLTFRGAVPTGELRRTLPAGWSLQALPVPLVGKLDRDLHCPFKRLEMVARWDAWTAELGFNVFADGKWFPGAKPVSGPAPEIQPGEGFWIWKEAPEDWAITFEPAP